MIHRSVSRPVSRKGTRGSSGSGSGTTVYAYSTINAMMADGANRSDGDRWEITGADLMGTYTSNAPTVHPYEMGLVPSRYIGAGSTYGYETVGDVTTDGNGDLVVGVGTEAGNDVTHYLAGLGSYSSEVILNIPNLAWPTAIEVHIGVGITTDTGIRFGVIYHDEGGDNPCVGACFYDGTKYIYREQGPGATGYSSTEITAGADASDGLETQIVLTLRRAAIGTAKTVARIGEWGGIGGWTEIAPYQDAAASNAHTLRFWGSTTTGEGAFTLRGVSVRNIAGSTQI